MQQKISASAPISLRLCVVLIGTVLCSWVYAQTVSEKVLGKITLEGTLGHGIVVEHNGAGFARRERIADGERYSTVAGHGETFDTILPGAVWIQDRLVYYARKSGKTFLVNGEKKQLIKGTPISPGEGRGRFSVSQDRKHFLAFISDGSNIRWYLDGKIQTDKFNRLPLTSIMQSNGVPLFVGGRDCDRYLVGQKLAGKAKWDLISLVSATPDGSVVYTYGERAGVKLLRKNEKIIFQEPLDSFQYSTDGKTWVAVVDRSADGVSRVELVRNGVKISEANVDITRQRLLLSADGSAWVWQIKDQDYVGSTLKQSNGQERRVDLEIADLILSSNGGRLALILKDTQQNKLLVEVDSTTLPPVDADTIGAFRFGPETSYAFKTRKGESTSIASHLGLGPAFGTVSDPLFLPDGRPAYIGTRPDARAAVIGNVETPLNASDIHFLDTLRIEGNSLRVLGTRGTEVVDFTVLGQ